MANHPLTILVFCIDSIGRFNASFGLTRKLKKRCHRVVYLVPERYQEKLVSNGFEVILGKSGNAQADEENLGETLAKSLLESGIIGPSSPRKKLELCLEHFVSSPKALQWMIGLSEDFADAMEQCQPDVVIIDHLFLPPALYHFGTPWVKFISTNPLMEVIDEKLPPGCSGFPTDGFNKNEWANFAKVCHQLKHSKEFNDYVEKVAHKRYPNDRLLPQTQLMTIYAYPEEMNYPEIQTKGWFNMEVFNKQQPRDLVDINKVLPKEFLKDELGGHFTGKWIYLSLGSMCSVDIDLMKRIVRLLGETNHKYVVSKGTRGEEYSLPKNMWGDRYVPQIEIIKFVDLVITHGGNNSITEIIAQGKPCIVLPMFWDQFNNAQRIHEKSFGIRLDAYRFTKEQLLESINKLLYDKALKQKLQIVAHRIQASNADEDICAHLEARICNNNDAV